MEWTQDELSERLHFSTNIISDIELEKCELTREIIFKIEELLAQYGINPTPLKKVEGEVCVKWIDSDEPCRVESIAGLWESESSTFRLYLLIRQTLKKKNLTGCYIMGILIRENLNMMFVDMLRGGRIKREDLIWFNREISVIAKTLDIPINEINKYSNFEVVWCGPVSVSAKTGNIEWYYDDSPDINLGKVNSVSEWFNKYKTYRI